MPIKGQKNRRNVSEIYDEVKVPVSFALTSSAIKKLDTLAHFLEISRSELLERIARSLSNILLPENTVEGRNKFLLQIFITEELSEIDESLNSQDFS